MISSPMPIALICAIFSATPGAEAQAGQAGGGAATGAESAAATVQAAPPAVIVDENDVRREEPPPHGAIGMSTAWRISDVAPNRTMEFRKRELHVGAAIGPHPIDHDEVYYVLSGHGEVVSDGAAHRLRPGMAAYLYRGAVVGIRQIGETPLTLIIAYPVTPRP